MDPAFWGTAPPTMGEAGSVSETPHEDWRIWTDEGGLAWADPGADRRALRSAIEDCASTLSPVGHPLALASYWIDRLLTALDQPGDRDLAHGNLWVLTLHDGVVEVRMDVDPPASEPLDVVPVDELARGLRALRDEVAGRLAARHELDGRLWSQQNPI
jgi:hypothetical protein